MIVKYCFTTAVPFHTAFSGYLVLGTAFSDFIFVCRGVLGIWRAGVHVALQ